MINYSPRLLFVVNVDWFFISHRLPIALKAISCGYEVHLATAYTSHRDYLDSLGIVTHELDFNRSRFNVANILSCLSILFSVKPMVVHLITMQPIIIGGVLSPLFRNTLFVFAISGFGHIFNSYDIFSKIRKFVVLTLYALALHLPSRKAIIVQNSRDFNLILSLKIDSRFIHKILGSGVPVKTFKPTPFPSYPPVIVFISRLLATKGLVEYVKSAPYVLDKFPNTRFLIVGKPDSSNPSAISQDYLTYVSSLPYITYLGHRTDIYNILSSAHLLILPSFYPEGLPKVLCEASACGRPVVTSNLPGCIDAIEEGVTGVSIPPKDHVLLAETIVNLLSDYDKLIFMSSQSRTRAEHKFDIDIIVSQHLQIYSTIL